MMISILILSYLLWLDDVYNSLKTERARTNLLLTTALVILLSWQVEFIWGIIMCCIGGIICLVAIIKSIYKNKR